MSITKSEAIIWIAISTGEADGEFTEAEIMDAINNTSYSKYFADADNSGINEKIQSKELNEESAVEVLKQLSQAEKIEALAICFGIAVSDEVATSEEKAYLFDIGLKIGIEDWEEVVKKYMEMSA
ncbi:MAG: hypothetical protein HXX09_05430 [Bacteroidetes bacterium]|nr:hypothetical protein [Bacteroidota bacterium]